MGNSVRKALLVFVHSKRPSPHLEFSLLDFLELAKADGLEVADICQFGIDRVTSATYLGRGQAEWLHEEVHSCDPAVVVFNVPLSATHQRNLEDALGVSVLNRYDLIFEIFERNAHTAEGKLQVELARLRYELPRLPGLGKELTNPGYRGPGEMKTRAQKSVLQRRIFELERKVKSLRTARAVRRSRRVKSGIPIVSIIGYTNAGKSALLNALTKSEVAVADRYFATLDPTVRLLRLPSGNRILVTDTVGFLDDLPSELIAAFKATLEEMEVASLLVHVVDTAKENFRHQIDSVRAILDQIGLGRIPRVTLFNKIDLLDERGSLAALEAEFAPAVAASVLTGENLKALVATIDGLI